MNTMFLYCFQDYFRCPRGRRFPLKTKGFRFAPQIQPSLISSLPSNWEGQPAPPCRFIAPFRSTQYAKRHSVQTVSNGRFKGVLATLPCWWLTRTFQRSSSAGVGCASRKCTAISQPHRRLQGFATGKTSWTKIASSQRYTLVLTPQNGAQHAGRNDG